MSTFMQVYDYGKELTPGHQLVVTWVSASERLDAKSVWEKNT